MAKKTTTPITLLSIKTSLQRVTNPITKHLTVIIVVAAIGVLIYSILTVRMIVMLQDDAVYRQKQSENRINGNFDKQTITKVNNLKVSSDTSTIDLPQGRRNPFIN